MQVFQGKMQRRSRSSGEYDLLLVQGLEFRNTTSSIWDPYNLKTLCQRAHTSFTDNMWKLKFQVSADGKQVGAISLQWVQEYRKALERDLALVFILCSPLKGQMKNKQPPLSRLLSCFSHPCSKLNYEELSYFIHLSCLNKKALASAISPQLRLLLESGLRHRQGLLQSHSKEQLLCFCYVFAWICFVFLVIPLSVVAPLASKGWDSKSLIPFANRILAAFS